MTQFLGEAIRRGMVARRNSPPAGGGVAAFRGRGGGSDCVMKNVLAGSTGKYAAWVSASHIEKAPQKNDPTP